MAKLKVYAAEWCPHCRRTVAWLTEQKIDFDYIDMDTIDAATEALVTQANGGDDWVVPTLEHDGRWRHGQFFNEDKLAADLAAWGIY